ncbi:PAS domain-containing hybrid sensor histidine kinase/response regulator [Spirosoma litoris]
MAFSSQPNDPSEQRADGLQATQKLLRATLDASMDMIQVFEAVRNQQGQIIDFTWILNNHTSEKIYGDVVGKSLLQFQPGVVEEGIFDAFKHVVETGEPQQYENQYVHEQFDGWFHQSVVKLNDGVATTTANITSRKRAQEQLQQSQAFLQSVIDSSLDVIQVFKAVRDEAGAILDFVWVMNNQKAVVQNGEVIGKSLLEQNPGVVPTGIFNHMVEVAQTGVVYEHEQYYNHEQFTGWFYQALVKTDDGVAMTTRDISRQKQAEGEVLRLKDEIAQKATDKYQALFNSIDQGFNIIELIFDDRGHVIDFWQREHNPVFTRLTGLNDAIGKRMSELVPYVEPEWHQMIETIYYTGEPIRIEYPVRALGQWFTAYMSRVGEAGSPFIACLYDDITERKQREQHQTFLLHFSDVLRTESDADAVANRALQLLAEHLQLDRCYVGVALLADNRGLFPYQIGNDRVPPMPQEGVRLSDFPQALRKTFDQTLVITDFQHTEGLTQAEKQHFAALGFGALVVANARKEAKKPDWSINAVSARPRRWTPGEIQLIEEVTERSWSAMERAKANKALLHSQERFESIANLVPDLLWDSGTDGATNWYNDRWMAYTGQTFEEAIGWGWTDAIHPDDRQASVRRYREAVAAGQSLRLEERIRRYDGVYRWFVVNASPLQDETGQVVKMYGAATDIHKSKQAEEALLKLEQRNRLAIEAAELATWEWDLVGDQVYWNEQHFHLLGMRIQPNPLPAEVFMRYLHPDDAASIQDQLGQAITQRTFYDAEFRMVREDGVVRWMSGYGRVTGEQDGKPVLASGVMMDITDRKQAELALQEADHRKDEFLAMLAHELRNPMSTLRSGLHILDLTITEEMLRPTVTMMSRQTEHLVRMVDDLLDVSRISRGKIELKKARVNLVALVQQAVEGVQAQFEQQGKLLQVSLPGTPIELEGDATRLTQVITNLLTNGLRYTGERGQVWLSLTHQGQEAILQVRDDGLGLAADQLSAIFELFVQVDNSLARSKGGLGLGLTLVKRLVEMHGGRVEAQSDGIGQGSSFRVHLPTLTSATAEQVAKPTPPATHSTQARRILVIDDNADAGFTLAMLLKLKGYEAHTRTSGREGIEAAEGLQPAAILLDIGMPVLDGYETCRAIRQHPWGNAIVVIALTGYGQEEDRQRAKEAGFDGHLVKPVDLGALTNLLTDLLKKGNTH